MANLQRQVNLKKFGLAYALLLGALGALSCILLQNSSEIIRFFIAERIEFQNSSVTPYSKIADISKLPPGQYYISVGRPRGLCDLTADGAILATTRSTISNLRSELSLGAGLNIVPGKPIYSLAIICDDEQGFKSGLTHIPFIAPYRISRIIQNLRELTTIYIGPFFSLLLIFSLLFIPRKLGIENSLPYVFFGFVALLYSLSLGHFPRLFIGGFAASILHWILRIAFSFSFYILAGFYSRWRRLIIFGYTIPIAGLLIALFQWPDQLDTIYDKLCITFSVLTFLSLFDLFNSQLRSRSGLYMRYVGCTWLILQCNDLSALYWNFGAYTAPAVVTLMSTIVMFIKRQEDLRTNQIELTISNALQIVEGAGSLEIRLKALMMLMHSGVYYPRCSLYVCGYALGLHDRPLERFYRIDEYGYKKDTTKDKIIDFRDGRGEVMRAALDLGKSILRQGQYDKSWFSCIPIGKYAVINLSDDIEKPAFLAAESNDFIERTLPALKTICERLSDLGAQMSYPIESLRLIRGEGAWEEEIGVIFLDINNYDDSVVKYRNPYARFVSERYLPALCKRVRRWAVREGKSAGDAVCLIVVSDLIQENCAPDTALYNALVEILQFAEDDGSKMCIDNGYDPIVLQIGASIGEATILCDPFQVRTAGEVLNIGSRLQKASAIGSTFIDANLLKRWPNSGLIQIDEHKTKLKKTRTLNGAFIRLSSEKVADAI